MPQLLRTDQFATFVKEPTLANYQLLRSEVTKHRLFDVHATRLAEIAKHFDAGRFRTVQKLSEPLQSLMQLSPSFHFFVGCASLELGQHKLAAEERKVSQSCLKALLASGDGTQKNPFQPTYRSDVYDVLRALNRETRCQTLSSKGKRYFDVVTSHDGVETWFDVTETIRRCGE